MVDTPSAVGKLPIAIIGAGRAGSTLGYALHAAGYPITAVWSRTSAHAAELAGEVGAVIATLEDAPEAAALALFAVLDDKLAGLVTQMADKWPPATMAAHCSGLLPAGVLAPLAKHGAPVGGFHPLASIAERHQTLIPGLTFAVEAPEPLRGILRQMARELGGQPFDLDPSTRPLYHAAAVLASNYTVVLAALAAELMQQAGIQGQAALKSIAPLLRSTLTNLERAELPDALTGPLARGDAGTVLDHLAALESTAPGIAQVYRTVGLAALGLVEARGTLDRATIGRLEDALGGASFDRPHLRNAMPALFETRATGR